MLLTLAGVAVMLQQMYTITITYRSNPVCMWTFFSISVGSHREENEQVELLFSLWVYIPATAFHYNFN